MYYSIVITLARVLSLIYTHNDLKGECIYTEQNTCACVNNYLWHYKNLPKLVMGTRCDCQALFIIVMTFLHDSGGVEGLS